MFGPPYCADNAGVPQVCLFLTGESITIRARAFFFLLFCFVPFIFLRLVPVTPSPIAVWVFSVLFCFAPLPRADCDLH